MKKDEGEAAVYFQGVINQVGEINPRDKRGPLVATAFRYMARFHRLALPRPIPPRIPPMRSACCITRQAIWGILRRSTSSRSFHRWRRRGKEYQGGGAVAADCGAKGTSRRKLCLAKCLARRRDKRVPGDGLGLLAIARRNASAEDKGWVGKCLRPPARKRCRSRFSRRMPSSCRSRAFLILVRSMTR